QRKHWLPNCRHSSFHSSAVNEPPAPLLAARLRCSCAATARRLATLHFLFRAATLSLFARAHLRLLSVSFRRAIILRFSASAAISSACSFSYCFLVASFVAFFIARKEWSYSRLACVFVL